MEESWVLEAHVVNNVFLPCLSCLHCNCLLFYVLYFFPFSFFYSTFSFALFPLPFSSSFSSSSFPFLLLTHIYRTSDVSVTFFFSSCTIVFIFYKYRMCKLVKNERIKESFRLRFYIGQASIFQSLEVCFCGRVNKK